jgi:hypothetical protein
MLYVPAAHQNDEEYGGRSVDEDIFEEMVTPSLMLQAWCLLAHQPKQLTAFKNSNSHGEWQDDYGLSVTGMR